MNNLRLKRLTRRALLPLLVATTVMFGVAGVFAYFSATGSGTGVALSGASTFPAPAVDPTGAPDFDLTNMAPGDTATQTVTVQAPGGGPSPSAMAIYEQGATGSLLSQLSLKVVEDGTDTLYDGAFDTTWTAASPLALPGRAGGLWAAGEEHTFVFTVTFALGAGNTYQTTNAGASFVWVRTQG
ncbi:MAG TPA: hypothetical protein VGM80_09900 [Gaiellaceae bacterium]|jgi:hypothetical protein